jgi:hypothetical protein
MFKFKPKNPLLTFYTNDNGFFTNDKPTFKMDHPDWLRMIKKSFKSFNEVKNHFDEIPTIKNCPGINYFMNEGIKFKLWADLKIRVYPTGEVEDISFGISMGTPLVQHNPRQYDHLYPSNKTAFKLNNPWIAKCEDDIKFLFTESHYSTNFFRENNMYIAPGIVDFKYQHAVNVHVLIDKKEEPYDLYLPYGTPLFTLYPLTEKKINIECKLINNEEYNSIGNQFPRCPMRRYYQLIKNLNS